MRYFFFLSFLLACFVAAAQQDENQLGIFEENSVVYRTQKVGGVIIYSNGIGGNFYWGKHLDGFRRRLIGVEVTTVKHPKEIRQYNPVYQDAQSYAFGKINSVIAVRPTIGLKNEKFDKLRENGVQVGYFFSVGPTFAILKPVYLDIGYVLDENSNPFDYDYIQTERYDPSQHTISNIYGRASFLNGLDELGMTVGLHVKAGAHFEYSTEKDGIRALEVGVAADLFPTQLPILATQVNQNWLVNLYLNILFGKKFKE